MIQEYKNQALFTESFSRIYGIWFLYKPHVTLE